MEDDAGPAETVAQEVEESEFEDTGAGAGGAPEEAQALYGEVVLWIKAVGA